MCVQEHRKLTSLWLNEVVLLIVIMAHELFRRLQGAHLYDDDIRILIWALQHPDVQDVFGERRALGRDKVRKFAHRNMNGHVCAAEELRINLLQFFYLQAV